VVRHLVLLVTVSACNQIFDLEAPELVEDVADADGDGVVDSRDNCPQLANADQTDNDRDRRGDACDDCPTSAPTRDRDQDGIDDACDSCVLGPDVDDDGDAVMDACDLCPATFGTQQFDDDGDIVGNECDVSVGVIDNERIVFDPLTELGPNWQGGADWELAPDGSSFTPTTTASLTWMDVNEIPATVSVAFTFAAESIVTVDVSSTNVSGAGPSGMRGPRCEVRCTQGQCALAAIGDLGTTPPMPIEGTHGTLKVAIPPSGMMQFTTIECTFNVDERAPYYATNLTEVNRSQSITITATPGAKVLGVDVIR
jgi:hypothetical protein